MKKILVLLSMVALAFGAWASVTYQWTVRITDIQVAGLPEDLVGYLVDKSVTGSRQMQYGGAVMAKAELDDFGTKGDKVTAYYRYATYDMVGHISYQNDDYAVLTSDGVGNAYVSFTLGDVKSDLGIDWNNMGSTEAEVNEYAKQNLYAVIYSPSTGRKLELPVTANAAVNVLGSSASFGQVIPEPTSGLLLILGVAGLALKRKKAA